MTRTARARADVGSIDAMVTEAIQMVRTSVASGTPADDAMVMLETFCATALRVLAKTNPSKIRSEARTVEIKARLDGMGVA